jgi:hypothetical protein
MIDDKYVCFAGPCCGRSISAPFAPVFALTCGRGSVRNFTLNELGDALAASGGGFADDGAPFVLHRFR